MSAIEVGRFVPKVKGSAMTLLYFVFAEDADSRRCRRSSVAGPFPYITGKEC